MKYQAPKLYRLFPAKLSAALCNDGNAASAPACVAGPEASGGCNTGSAAGSACDTGAAAGANCKNGIGFQ